MHATESKQPGWRRLLRRRWLWWLVGIVLVFNLVLVGTPYGLGYGLKRYLLDQGLEKVELGDVDFNPFTGRLTVVDLEASAGGRVLFGVPEGTLDLGWLPLWRKRVYIEQVTLKGAKVVLSEQEDGRWRYGGFEPPWEEKVAPVEDAATLWEVGARELHLVDVHYLVEGKKFRAEADIDEARLERATAWEPDQAGELSIRGRVNGAELELAAEAWPFARVPRLRGHVKLIGFPLTPIAPMSQPALDALQGLLDLDVDLEGQYTPESGLSFAQEGVVALNGLQARSKDFDLADQSLRWEGRLEVSVPPSGLPSLTAKGALAQGATSVALPAGKVSVRHGGLSWSGTLDYALAEAGSQVAVDGQIAVRELDVAADRQTAKQERLAWTGTVKASLPKQGAGPEIVAEGKLDAANLGVNLPDGTAFGQSELKWQGKLHQFARDGSTVWRTTGKLETRGMRLERPDAKLKEDRLTWEGTLSLTLPDKGDLEIAAEGKLDAANLGVNLPDGTAFGQSELKWQGKLHQSARDGSTAWQTTGKFETRGMRLERPDVKLKEDRLTWEGALSLTLPDKGDLALSVDGQLAGGEFQALLPGQGLETRHQAFTWTGRFDHGGAVSAETSESELNLGGLEVSAPKQALILLAVKELRLEGIRLDKAGAGSVARTRLDQLTMLAPTPPSEPAQPSKKTAPPAAPALFRASEAIAEGVELTPPGRLGIGVIQVKGGEGFLRRDSEGRWYVLERLTALTGEPGAPATGIEAGAPSKSEEDGPTMRIDLVRLKDGQIRLEDEAVTPPFRTTLHIAEANMTDLDSRNPKQRSEISLNGRLGKYTGVKLRSEFQPFQERLSLEGAAKVDGLEMPPLAPYTIQQVGYTFTSGELDAEVDLNVDKGDIKGEARLVFNQLEVEANPAKQPQAPQPTADWQDTDRQEGSQGGLNMPIETALSLLRDRDNSIRLKIPVSGDVSDPKFSVQDAINKALGKASRKAALTYVKFAIQPYGAILAGAEIAGKVVTVVRLDPVTFNAGQSQLTEAGTDYLDKVAKVLKDRPQVTIKLCGKATEDDRRALQAEALARLMAKSGSEQKEEAARAQAPPASAPALPDIPDEELKALAEARAVGVEDHLVETHGAAAGRLVLCGPKIDLREDAQPRVDLEI